MALTLHLGCRCLLLLGDRNLRQQLLCIAFLLLLLLLQCVVWDFICCKHSTKTRGQQAPGVSGQQL